MADKVAEILARPADDLSRFEALEWLLHSPEHRIQFEDYIEEAIRRQSGDVAAKMFARARFYAELVRREGERLNSGEQLDALTIINEHFPRILEAIDHAMSNDDSEHLAIFAAYIGIPLEFKGKFELGIKLFDSIIKQAEATNNKALEIESRIRYGDLLVRAGRLEHGYATLSHALQLSQLHGTERNLALVLSALGHVTRLMGRYEESLAYYTNALENARKTTEKVLLARALSGLAGIALYQRRLADARRLCTESLDIKRALANIHGIAGDLHNLAVVASWEGANCEAQGYYLEALDLNRRIGNHLWEAANLSGLGGILYEMGHFDEAKECFKRAQAIVIDGEHKMLVAVCQYHFGCVAFATEDYEDAQRHFEEGIQLNRAIGAKAWVGVCLYHMGELQRELGDKEAAKRCLSEALAIGNEIGDPNISSSALTNSALLAMATGKSAEAEVCLHRALRLASGVGMPRSSLISLHACLPVLLAANKYVSVAVLAQGIHAKVTQFGFVFRKKFHSDLRSAIAKCSSTLSGKDQVQAEDLAASLNVPDLVDYALRALEELRPELGDAAADSAASQLSARS